MIGRENSTNYESELYEVFLVFFSLLRIDSASVRRLSASCKVLTVTQHICLKLIGLLADLTDLHTNVAIQISFIGDQRSNQEVKQIKKMNGILTKVLRRKLVLRFRHVFSENLFHDWHYFLLWSHTPTVLKLSFLFSNHFLCLCSKTGPQQFQSVKQKNQLSFIKIKYVYKSRLSQTYRQ